MRVEEAVKKLKGLSVENTSSYERLKAARAIIADAITLSAPVQRMGTAIQDAHALENYIHSRLLSVPTIEQVARQASRERASTVLSRTADTLGVSVEQLKRERPAVPWLKNGRRDMLKLMEGKASSSAKGWRNALGPEVTGSMDFSPIFPHPIPTEIYVPPPSYRFCVPPNPVLKGIILEAELNLYKLRRCRDIAGMEREVDLYSAPTDVETDLPTLDEDGQIALSLQSTVQPTNHHYAVLIARSKEMGQIAAQMESSLHLMKEGAAETTMSNGQGRMPNWPARRCRFTTCRL